MENEKKNDEIGVISLKAKLIKELHEIGVYRDLVTKRKLECMKVSELLNLKTFVEEEQARGVEFKRMQEDYVFVTPITKKGKKKR